MKDAFESAQGRYEPITNKPERLLNQDDRDVWQDDEENHLPTQRIRPDWFKLPYSLFSVVWSTLNTVLLLVILFYLSRGDLDSYRTSKLDVGGDVTGWGPKGLCGSTNLFQGMNLTFMSIVTKQWKKFAPDPAFVPENPSEVFSDSVRQAWLDIVPRKCALLHYPCLRL
jgi:hypothetical protein